jgi:hypothetical protein
VISAVGDMLYEWFLGCGSNWQQFLQIGCFPTHSQALTICIQLLRQRTKLLPDFGGFAPETLFLRQIWASLNEPSAILSTNDVRSLCLHLESCTSVNSALYALRLLASQKNYNHSACWPDQLHRIYGAYLSFL